jgi:hypothetical protein
VTFSFGDISGSLLASLQDDGLLNVMLSHQHGEFIFDGSIFTANGARESESPNTDSEVNRSRPPSRNRLVLRSCLPSVDRANRPFVDTSKPAISGERPRQIEFYRTRSSDCKSVWTFVRQLRGPHLSTCPW